VAIVQSDASSPWAFIVINGGSLGVSFFGSRAFTWTDQHIGAVARAYQTTSILDVFLGSRVLVFAHLVTPHRGTYLQDDTRHLMATNRTITL